MTLPNLSLQDNVGFFLQKKEPSKYGLKNEILDRIKKNISLAFYNQYKNYTYKKGYSANDYLYYRIKNLIHAEKGEWVFFYDLSSKETYLLGIHLSNWDEEHFELKMARLEIFTIPDKSSLNTFTLQKLVVEVINYVKRMRVRFVSSRINGDFIDALHVLENTGFRYYENVIWPIVSTSNLPSKNCIRLIKPDEIGVVKQIAKNNNFNRGHFHCDKRFDSDRVNAMYPKWIETSISNNEYITVIEHNNRVAGFFAFKIDSELQIYTGYKYGRLSLLAIDSAYRGLGLGERLFKGTLSFIKGLGADFIDSGYSTKNHISSKLHGKYSFYSVYEEVTFHLWLDE